MHDEARGRCTRSTSGSRSCTLPRAAGRATGSRRATSASRRPPPGLMATLLRVVGALTGARCRTNQSRASGRGLGQGARLLEEVGGARRRPRARLGQPQPGAGLPVEVEHDVVGAADDEQRRRPHRRQPGAGEVGAAAAGDHRRDVDAGLGGGPERGPGAGAGAEVARPAVPRVSGRAPQPLGGRRRAGRRAGRCRRRWRGRAPPRA